MCRLCGVLFLLLLAQNISAQSPGKGKLLDYGSLVKQFPGSLIVPKGNDHIDVKVPTNGSNTQIAAIRNSWFADHVLDYFFGKSTSDSGESTEAFLETLQKLQQDWFNLDKKLVLQLREPSATRDSASGVTQWVRLSGNGDETTWWRLLIVIELVDDGRYCRVAVINEFGRGSDANIENSPNLDDNQELIDEVSAKYDYIIYGGSQFDLGQYTYDLWLFCVTDLTKRMILKGAKT